MTTRGFDAIQAQDAATTTLRRAVTEDRLAHTYLFEGPSGVGKEMAALALAAATVCNDAQTRACDCDVCRRIYAGQHPDVRVVRPRDEGDRNLKVEQVREVILPFTKFAPFEARAAFVIFPEADVSFPVKHADSANVLLKTLEEPRKNVHFVFLSERPDRLLPTVRSRSQRVRFRALPPVVINQILDAHSVPVEVRGPAISLAAGQADRALALCAEGRAERLLEFSLRVDDALQHGAPGTLLDLSEELARSDDLPMLLSALALFYRDLGAVALGVGAQSLGFQHAAPTLIERAQLATAQRFASRVQRIHQTFEELQRNANPELAINALLFGLT